MHKKSNYMPLKLWAIIFLIPILIFSSTLYINKKREIRVYKEIITTQLHNYSSKDRLIIFVGNSLLDRAVIRKPEILGDGTYSTLLSIPGYDSISLTRHLDFLYDLNPDILILQSALFTQEDMASIKRFQYNVRHASRQIRKGITVKFTVCSDSLDSEKINIDKLASHSRGFYEKPKQTMDTIRPWIQKTLEKGIRLVIIDIPRDTQLEEKLGDDFLNWRKEIIVFAKTNNIPFISKPTFLTSSDFCDLIHMSDAAKQKYTHWLSQEIKKIIDDTD